MKRTRFRTILVSVGVLLVLGYSAIAIIVASSSSIAPPREGAPAPIETIAIFGASGTAGDGILKAALASPDIRKIHVVTRRSTQRIEQGVASGKVEVTTHMDYLDYSAFIDKLAGVDAVFWAIGVSAIGMEEVPYRRIHVDFPRQFVREWLEVNSRPDISFHFISSSDISEESTTMWVRVKIESEKVLFGLAADTKLRVIAYRPDYIGPTDEEAHLGQKLLYWFFRPLGAAVKAEQIGNAMIEVAIRESEFANGDKLGTWKIWRYSDAYVE